MNNKTKNNTLPKDIEILIISSVIALIIISGLWFLGFKNESIITGLLGLTIWTFRAILNRHFQNIDRKIDEHKQILLQGTQAGFGFKQIVMTNMYNITNKLWEKTIWIAQNWNALWPGHDDDKEIRTKFREKLEDYFKFLKINSINIPSQIYEAASNVIYGINTYEFGRDERDDKQADLPTRKHGSKEMLNGAKLVKSSITELFQLIRSEFGLESLPGEILNIKQPDEEEN